MKRIIWATGFAFLLFASLLSHTPAQAQASRTWVASGGGDANPCSRTAPCKTFAGAIAKTAVGGTISVIDSSGYGALRIGSSINIVAEGAQAGVLGGGISIQAGATDVVRLQGLSIEASGASGDGVRIVSAGAVQISQCSIAGYAAGNGISVEASAATNVFVSDCTIALNGAGVSASGTGGGGVFLDRVRLVRNQSAIVGKGSPTIFHLNASTLANNAVAIDQIDGKILSFGNNALMGNDSDGGAMGAEPLK
jgi:hypothetical protein